MINESSVSEFDDNFAIIKYKKIYDDAFFLNDDEKNTAIKNDSTFTII